MCIRDSNYDEETKKLVTPYIVCGQSGQADYKLSLIHIFFLAIAAYLSATSFNPSIRAISLYPATPMIAFTERLAL